MTIILLVAGFLALLAGLFAWAAVHLGSRADNWLTGEDE